MSFNHLNIDLLKISAEALKHKKEDPSVINATVGVFLDDYNNLYSFSSVKESFLNLNEEHVKSYMSPSGGRKYLDSVYQYIFKDAEELFDNFYINGNWASGGSGAIYMALSLYKGENVLLPNIRWPEYDNTCQILNKTIIEYNLIKDNKFDLKSIKKIFNDYKFNEIMLIINDPAHNPTGYNMSSSEYQELIKELNNYKNTKINILIDLAYIDFSGFNYRKEILPIFKDLNENIDLYLAFSGSKSFGVYGLRMGALIKLTKNLKRAEEFKTLMYKKTGAIHGAPNSLSILLLNDLLERKTIYNDQIKASLILKSRADLLIDELRKYSLQYFPYNSGFFLTVKTNNPLVMTNKLKENNVYVVPTYKGIRIALSAIKDEEIKRIVKIIKENKEDENG